MPADGASILIAAVSGRALAASARRAGLIPLVADFFADADTGRLAHACLKLAGPLKRGMRWSRLEPALDALQAKAPSPVLGLLYGSGFEDRTALLDKAAARWTLLGNDASVVAKREGAGSRSLPSSPGSASRIRRRCPSGRPRPRAGSQSAAAAPAAATWSSRAARHRPRAQARFISREQVEGRPVSALFIGNGREARVLGFSEQWAAPTPSSTWRYGGALCPADLSPENERLMTEATLRVAAAFQLRGLGSADFLVGDEGPLLLEINPRPGATLDIFDSDDMPLLGLHLDAVAQAGFRPARLNLTARAPRPLSTPRKPSKYHPRCPGPIGPQTSRKAENGSTKTVRYALCGPALRLKSKQDAWSRRELPGF